MSAPANTTKSVEPVLRVLEALCRYAAEGASNKDLAEASGVTPVGVTRATQTLMAYGWCRKSEESGRFFPTAQFTRLSFSVSDSLASAQKRLDDLRHSLTGR